MAQIISDDMREGDMVPLEKQVSLVQNIRKQRLPDRNMMSYYVEFAQEMRWDGRGEPTLDQKFQMIHDAARHHIDRNNKLFSTLETGNRVLDRWIEECRTTGQKDLEERLISLRTQYAIPL